MKQLLIFLAALLMVSCTRYITTQNLPAKATVTEKLFYALPRNTFDVEIKVKETKFIRTNTPKWKETCIAEVANEFDIDPDDLKKLLTTKEATIYGMYKDSITAALGAKPDVEKVYALQVEPTFFTDNVVGLTFTQDHILSDASVSVENRGFEMGLATVNSIVGVAGAFMKGSSSKPEKLESECLKEYGALNDAIRGYTDYIVNNVSPFTVEAYQTGKAYWSKRVEKEFEKAFFKKTEKVYSVKFSLDMDNQMTDGKVALFRLDKTTGKVTINNKFSGRYKTSTPDKLNGAAMGNEKDWYVLELTRATDDVNARIDKFTPSDTKQIGLVYNVPGTAIFTLWKPEVKEVVFSNIYRVAQFGKTASLNPKFTKASVTLDPLTGGLLKAGGESKSLAASNITGVGDAIVKGRDTLKKPTEEEELEKQAKILELKAKIKTLEAQQ